MASHQVTRIPPISVIVPAYNAERFLAAALQSVLAQDQAILEIIVIDDGSSDRSAEIALSFPKVKVLRQGNLGPAAARNRGISEAQGAWLAFIDADDIWAPGSLRSLAQILLDDPTIDVAVGRFRAVSEEIWKDGQIQFLGPALPNFVFGTSLFRREVFAKTGPLDQGYRIGEDTEWCLRAREKGIRIQPIEDIIVYYRRHSANLTQRSYPELTLKLVKESLDRRRKGSAEPAASLAKIPSSPPKKIRPEEYFNSVSELFAKACGPAGGIARRFRIGKRLLELRFSGPAMMARIAPALAHLEVFDSEKPEARILIWDSASTGVAMLPPPWKFDLYLGKGEVKEFSDERFFTAYQHGPDALNLWDNERRIGVFWVRDAAALPFYESSAPLRYLLHFWAMTQGQQLIHAAAVGRPDGALLLTGKGGLGKSTTAVSTLFSSLRFAGDDYVLLDSHPAPEAHSLYATAKLNDDSLRWFPELAAHVVNRERQAGEKSFALLGDTFRERLISGFPLKAIAIPSVGGGEARFEPISPIECLKALAPSTLVQLPAASAAVFRGLSAAVRALPCYRFHLGSDPKLLPETMERLLA